MSPIIFLDIDGVLAHRNYSIVRKPGGAPSLDPKCVARLNKIIKETGAKVVVHSTWINGFPLKVIQDRLQEAGFDLSDLHVEWPAAGPKPKNILQWLQRHADTVNFVILEDEQLFDLVPGNKRYIDRYVQVFGGWFETGLRDKDVEAAIHILKTS